MNTSFRLLLVGLAATAMLNLHGCADVETQPIPPVSKTALLTGGQENPPALTAATGSGTLTMQPETGEISGSVVTTGMTGVAAHIHVGAAGVNGPVIVTLNESPAGSGTWVVPAGSVLNASQQADFTAGNLYFNVHSAIYPGGQVRGQIGLDVKTATLSGAQENPAAVSAASGYGIIAINPTTRAATGRVVTSGMTGTAAHIHEAAAGVNGPVRIDLTESAAGSGIWVIPAGTVLTEALVTALNSGNLYFNVHSAAFPGGQIRGQIGREVFNVTMSAAQEVPPTASAGSAAGRLVLDPATRQLTGTLTTSGFTASAAHVHTGLFGVNGPVLVGFTQASAGSAEWQLPATTLTVAQVRDLLFGDLYLNAHSPTFPGGEVRGQIGNVVRTAGLTAAQEVPPTTSAATARGVASFNPVTLAFSATVVTTGLTSTAAHLHLAAAGSNGAVIVGFEQNPTGTWIAPSGATLTAERAAAFASGGTYFNVHSAAFPGGEIRGQVTGRD